MTRRLWIWGLTTCAAAGLFASVMSMPAQGRQGVVKTVDGRTFEGDVDNSKPESVTIAGKGGSTTIPREDVASLEWAPDVQAEYQARLAKLSPNADAPGHVALARWLFDHKAYKLAQIELETAMRIDPNNSDANSLYQTVQSQRRLEESKAHPEQGPTPPVNTAHPATQTGNTTGHTATERVYLTPQDINIIRQDEWRSNDTTVNARVEPETRKKYVEYAGGTEADFNKNSQTDQAATILANGLPEMRKGVIILNDPADLAQYKRTIQPIIVNGCATVGCHGGPNGGNFFLYPDTSRIEAAYTNFYLLTQYTKVDEYGTKRFMIDRTYPDQSLLLQYGLSGDVAQARHPEVPKGTAWRGIFTGRDDPKYKQIFDWMSKSLKPVAPDYGIHFTLDTHAATQPSMRPAGGAAPSGAPAGAPAGAGQGG